MSLLLTGACTALFLISARSQDASRFERIFQAIQDRITGQLDLNITLMRGAAGFFAASEVVSPQEFHTYVQRLELERHAPGIEGLGFSQYRPSDKEARNSILYLEPSNARNQAALGSDMSREPIHHEAMERAWLLGEPALSGKVALPRDMDAGTQAGFLLYVPAYRGTVPSTEEGRRRNLVGFVYCAFQARALFDGMYSREHQPRVLFRVYDGLEIRPENLLYDSAAEAVKPLEPPRFSHISHLKIGGRPWTIVFTSNPEFDAALLMRWAPAVLGLSLLLSLMVFMVAWTQVSARHRAEANEAERARLLAREQEARREAEASREEARSSAEKLQIITNTLPALVSYVDTGEHYRFVNRAYETWFGIKPENLVGKTIKEAFGEQVYSRFGPPIHRALAGEMVRYEGELRHQNGRTLYTQSSYLPDRDAQGQVRGIVVLAFDITERRQSEEAVRSAVRLRDEFLSVASHELKTPLTPLSLKLQMLAREAATQPESPFVLKIRSHVETGRQQIKRLSDLIGDLLDVSRISSGKMKLHWEPVDFAAVVREVLARLEPEATKAESPLTLEAPEALVGRSDRMRFEQVAENLMTNAIKYGAGKPILVRLETNNDRIILTVQDQGIGIAPEHQARIFERYERAVSDRNYGGLGLGLYITQTIVVALGGTIRVQSQLDQGASFTVELPREVSAP